MLEVALPGRMRMQTEAALEDADVALFVMDARAGLTPLDEEIARLHADLPDLTILYVTHDQSEALTLADRIAILNALGVPTTGWNAQSLDAATTEAYNAAIVLTPHGAPRLGDGPNGTRVVLADPDPRAGVRVRLFRTPPIDRESLLPPSPDPDKEVVFFDETVPWAVVARQAGSVVRVVPVNETAGGAVGGKAPVVVERAEPAGQE